MISSFEMSISDMQGRLFELSGKKGYASRDFIKGFIKSEIAKELDSEFNFMQWAGKEYILERMEDEYPQTLVKGEIYDDEVLFWIGYTYRYWHYYTGESSRDILKQAPVEKMNVLFLGYHTMSCELAIDKLKEEYAR